MNNVCIIKDAISPWMQNNFPGIKKYINFGTNHSVSKGTILLSPGERCNHIYYLTKGMVKASLVNLNGQEKIISVIGPHTLIAEGLPNINTNSPVLISALEKCDLVAFNATQIEKLIDQNPSFTFELLNFFNLKYQMLISLYQGHLFYPPPQRLCRLICILGDTFGEQIAENTKIINLRITQHYLADLLGVSRVTVATILKDMRQNNIVEIKQKRIIYHSTICQYCQRQ